MIRQALMSVVGSSGSGSTPYGQAYKKRLIMNIIELLSCLSTMDVVHI